jgi:hypothetical protein
VTGVPAGGAGCADPEKPDQPSDADGAQPAHHEDIRHNMTMKHTTTNKAKNSDFFNFSSTPGMNQKISIKRKMTARSKSFMAPP